MGDRTGSGSNALQGLARREVDFRPLVSWLSRQKVWIIVGFGVILRVAEYLTNRAPWLDEGSLAGNIIGKTLGGLFGPLSAGQMAPPGFLVVEWVAFRALGRTLYALRLFPLIGGVASVFLFRAVAVRVLRARDVWVAVALFAVSDDLIYFASELKPYSTDVAAALACLLMGIGLASRPATARRLAAVAVAGAAMVWISFPSAIVLAGVGSVLLASALARREWARVLGLALASAAWGASFAVVYVLAKRQLEVPEGMWVFWAFSFPEVPPRSLWDASWPIRWFLYLFVNPLNFNPLNFSTPLGWRLSTLPAVLFALAGFVSLWRRDRMLFAMVASPIAVAFALAYLHLYPCHGRLALYLVPSLLLPIAEGAGRACEAVGRGVLKAALLATILLFPTLGGFYYLLLEPRMRDFNPHGDRRPTRLDPSWFPLWDTSRRPGSRPVSGTTSAPHAPEARPGARREDPSGTEPQPQRRGGGPAMSGKIYHPEDKHPRESQSDLNPDASKGQNYGLVGHHPKKDNPRTAYDVKEVHRRLRDFTDDLLKQIPILPEGSRLEQDATYIDLASDDRREIHATGDMEAGPGHYYVPKSEVDYQLWNRLIGVANPARTGQGNAP